MAPNGSGGIRGFRPGALAPARVKHPAMIIPDALAEGMARLSDRADPVSDEIWDEAARHYDERGLAALMLMIATPMSATAATSPSGHRPAPGAGREAATWRLQR